MGVVVTPPRATYRSELPRVSVVKQANQVVISLDHCHKVILSFSELYKKMSIPDGVSSNTLTNSDVKLLRSVSNRNTILFFLHLY